MKKFIFMKLGLMKKTWNMKEKCEKENKLIMVKFKRKLIK